MTNYDGGFILHDQEHTVEELEEKLKLVVWDWQVDGDVETSKANLETYKRASAIYQALRRDYGETKNFTPQNPVCNVDRLVELNELWNKYAPAKDRMPLAIPTIG